LVATVHPHLYWPSLTRSQTVYEGVSKQLRPLTQDRFLSAALIDNPPLPVGKWWALEHLDDGRPFMWAGEGAELWLPPVPEGSLIGLELRPAPGESPLMVDIGHGGGSFEIDGRAEATRVWSRTGVAAITEPLIIRLDRVEGYPPGGGDERLLSAQLLDVVVRPPGSAWGGSAASESERGNLRLKLEGGYGGENFGEFGRGVWLGPRARLRITVDEEGMLLLRLAAPRPTPANPRVVLGGEVISGPFAVDQGEVTAEIRVGEVAVGAGFIEFDLLSEPYQPSAHGGGGDDRELGVVLLGVEFLPENPTVGWWNEPLQQ